MGQTQAKTYKLKTGESLTVRSAEPGDVRQLLRHARKVLAEHSYFVNTLEEFERNIDKERRQIRQRTAHPDRIILLAELDGSVVGALSFENGSRKRLAHRGVLHMSVLPEFRNKGVGTALLESLIEWAEKNPAIEKLALSVFADNEPAIHLYKKMGFVEEGRRVREIKMAEGRYLDDVLMCRFIE